MIFLAVFSLSVLFGTVVGLTMLYLPVEMENPVDADVARTPEHKMTWADAVRHYARELRAPENEMKRRACAVWFFAVLASASLVLLSWEGAEAAADRALWPPRGNGTG